MGLYEASKERFGFAYCMFSSLRRFSMRRNHYTKGNKKWRLQQSWCAWTWAHDRFDATRWDQTLKELHEMGIGDFNELVTYDSKPVEYDTGTESWRELSYFEDDFLEYEEEKEEKEIERLRQEARTPYGIPFDDDDYGKPEEPEGSWADLWRESYEYEEDEIPEESWSELVDSAY